VPARTRPPSRPVPNRIAPRWSCYRMLGNLHDAEDVTQETLLRVWRTRDSFEGNASVHTWLYRIATNACLDLLRTRRRRPVILERVAHPPPTGTTSPVAASWLEPTPIDCSIERAGPSKTPWWRGRR
jgi:RNA polymerase sigma-70 factor, ECF subfamily